MAAGRIYRIQSTNVEGKFIKVDILDNSIQSDTPQVIELTGGDAPIRLSSIDNSEGKFTPIRAQQCTIQFLSTGQYGVKTFSSGSDNRFTVIVLYDTSIIFEGFLSLDDNKELFIDGVNTVELTANDKLGALKDVVMVDFNGEKPEGKYTIAQWIAMCLNLTGTPRELRIVNSLRHGVGSRTTSTAIFTAADSSIEVDFNINFFYPGQIITVTGSVSNGGDYTVASIESSTKIIVESPVVDETASLYNVTFTDYSSAAHFAEHKFDALTFEAEGGLLDPYTILSRILANWGECFYMDFCWWIMRKAEKYKPVLPVAKYSIEGEFDEIINVSYTKSFGFDEVHWFADERTEIHTVRPLGLLRLTYRYAFPKEMPCNADFSRGEEIQAPDLSAPSSQGRYTPECWTLYRYAGGSPTSTMYIQRNYEYGYEKSRYLTITPASASSETSWAESTPLPVNIGARGSLTVEYSAESNFGAGEGAVEYDIVFIWIRDKDANYWYWTDLDMGGSSKGYYSWEGPFLTEQNRPVSATWNLDATDETDPQTLTVSLDAMPVSGDIYFGLPQFNQTGSGFDDNVIIRYNINFTYTPKVNGSYTKYNAEQHTITQPEAGYSSKYEKDAYIADAPEPYMIGAMFWESPGPLYTNTSRWYDSSGDSAIRKPFLWWCAFDVWNQYRPSPTVLEFFAAGVGATWPHIAHSIVVTDIDSLTQGRQFEIITFEKDLRRCTISGNMTEISRDGYDYNDPYEYKYIT